MAIAHDQMILMHALEPLDRKPVRTVPDEVGRFLERDVRLQRAAICDYVRRYEDLGAVSECIGHHPLTKDLMAAFLQGDTAQMGHVLDKMIREYVGRLVQQEWDGQS